MKRASSLEKNPKKKTADRRSGGVLVLRKGKKVKHQRRRQATSRLLKEIDKESNSKTQSLGGAIGPLTFERTENPPEF